MRRDATAVGLAASSPRSTDSGDPQPECVWLHASCVQVHGVGVILLGPSGSGKSDLALQLIDAGGRLVADDQLAVERLADRLFGRPAASLAGLLEVRGFGIVRLPWCEPSPLGLAVRLDRSGQLERLPEPGSYEVLGLHLPQIRLDPYSPSAGAKIRLALRTQPAV
jgi:serine kinase of HPr protein (carbohydrate metabolism regulator)